MDCPRCHATMPEVAHYCQRCGNDLRTTDMARRQHFAVKPDEAVASFALISTIMPRSTGTRPQTYKIALMIALVVSLVAAIFGALPIAVLVAAFAIPVVYIVYIYDVNLWEDEPIPVTLFAFVLTGVLAAGFTVLWIFLRGPLGGLGSGFGDDLTGSSPQLGQFLIVVLLVPIVGEAIKQIGPLVLASRPEFDDLMDGLTFGVISGVAYATFDTLVKHWSLLTGGLAGLDEPGLWVSLIFLEGFVKPLIFGTATGIACAEFSGLGEGYDGFTPRYVRGLAEAIVANAFYQAGTYLFSFVGNSTLAVILSVIWGLLILGVLIIRVRNILHVGLMEAALERYARNDGIGENGDLQFCSQCELPLMNHAAFCNACGTATRVMRHAPRRPAAATSAGAAGAGAAGAAVSGAAVSGAGGVATLPDQQVGSPERSTPDAVGGPDSAFDQAAFDQSSYDQAAYDQAAYDQTGDPTPEAPGEPGEPPVDPDGRHGDEGGRA